MMDPRATTKKPNVDDKFLKQLFRELDNEIAQNLINAQSNGKRATLHYVVDAGHPKNAKVVQTLLDQKANLNAKGERNRHPLHIAAIRGCRDVTQTLLNHKDNLVIDAKDTVGLTPLDLACY